MGISDFPSEVMKKLTYHNAVRNMSITEDMKQDYNYVANLDVINVTNQANN